MSNLEKYNSVFTENFIIETKDLTALKYQDIDTWDSVGHMALMAGIEEAFGVELDIDDIIEFSGYEVGKEILAKYNVTIEAES